MYNETHQPSFLQQKTHKTACKMTVSYMFFSPDQLRGPAPKMGNTILDQNLVTKSSPPTAPIFDLTLKQESFWILMVDDKESHSRMTTAKCS